MATWLVYVTPAQRLTGDVPFRETALSAVSDAFPKCALTMLHQSAIVICRLNVTHVCDVRKRIVPKSVLQYYDVLPLGSSIGTLPKI